MNGMNCMCEMQKHQQFLFYSIPIEKKTIDDKKKVKFKSFNVTLFLKKNWIQHV